jgi:hypothetical protein
MLTKATILRVMAAGLLLASAWACSLKRIAITDKVRGSMTHG